METIIQQIINNLVKEIIEYLNSGGISNIGKALKDMVPMIFKAVLEILKAVIMELDQALVSDKSLRKEDGLRIKERDVPRKILLSIGELEYSRTYFESLKKGERRYLLDELIGVEKSSRMSREIEVELVSKAADMSYARSSSSVCEGILSRQTVRNKVLDVSELAYMPDKSDKTPRELHIFADEDHVHMQPNRNGVKKRRGSIVRLITVSEGLSKVSKGRNELISPIHFDGYKIKPLEQWEYVQGVLTEIYDMDKVECIWIHGDGASWIKRGLDVFPNAKLAMDTYHLNKAIKTLIAGSAGAGMDPNLWHSIKKDRIDEFTEGINIILDRVCDYYVNEKGRNNKQDKIIKTASYITSNWESVQNRINKVRVGSCTEPLVSHILSARLSRNPMGWSKQGLSQMAMIRVYSQNGGLIGTEDVRSGRDRQSIPSSIKKYENLVEGQLASVMKDAKNWAWMDGESYSYGKTTGTTVLLRSYSRMRNVS